MSLIFDLEEADARRLFPQPAPRRGAAFTPLFQPGGSRGNEARISKKSEPPRADGGDSERASTQNQYEARRFRRWVPRRRRRLWIEKDTPIVPFVVADDMCHEVSLWLGEDELPRSWKVRLAVRADVVYYHRRQLRQGARRSGRNGLNYLRAFMRHWLASMLYHRRPDWARRLPADYARGADLDVIPDRPSGLQNPAV